MTSNKNLNLSRWQKIKSIIILKRVSIILIVDSFLYGFQLFRHPEILEHYAVYTMIRELFDARLIGSVFMILSGLKIYGVIKNCPIAKKLARTGLMFVWFVFLIAFMVTPPPNTVWILAFTNVMLIVISTISSN